MSAGKLVSLINLGWSDYRIACHFGVQPGEGVSSLTKPTLGLADDGGIAWKARDECRRLP